jgi:hypothetical protein
MTEVTVEVPMEDTTTVTGATMTGVGNDDGDKLEAMTGLLRAIMKNKRDQVIVTIHASKLEMNTRTRHVRTRTQRLYRKVKIQEPTNL